MAIRDFVQFDNSTDGACNADADIAGIGVVGSFTAAAIFTTALSICAALLDGVNDHSRDTHAVFPSRLNDWLRQVASERIRQRGPFYREVLNRLMLAMADQQLLTGFAIIISGYVRAAESEPGPNHPTYFKRLIEAHFHLIVYLSCLSSSSHLACVITLKKYFSQHNTSAWVRLGLIVIFALLLAATICLAVPFGPSLAVIQKIEEYKDDHECESISSDKCSNPKYYSGLILFYFVAIVAVLYPFWVAIIQLSEHTKQAIEKFINRCWSVNTAWLPMYWIRRCRPTGKGRFAWILSFIGTKSKSAFRLLLFGNMMLSFSQQLLFITISLAFVLAQKFARSPDPESLCSLNTPSANRWGFGQVLPIILLGQFILSGSGAYYEIRDEEYASRRSSEGETNLNRPPPRAEYSRWSADIPQLYTNIPSSRISIDNSQMSGSLSQKQLSSDLRSPPSTYRRNSQRSDLEMGFLGVPRRPG